VTETVWPAKPKIICNIALYKRCLACSNLYPYSLLPSFGDINSGLHCSQIEYVHISSVYDEALVGIDDAGILLQITSIGKE
jgi:hypothetical protein